MDSAHSVLVTAIEDFERLVEVEDLRRIAAGVLTAESVPSAELGVLITDDEAVRRLNLEYAGEDETTDVLAFSLQEGEEFVSPDGVSRLGEVIISYPTASRQAAEAGTDGRRGDCASARPRNSALAGIRSHGGGGGAA